MRKSRKVWSSHPSSALGLLLKSRATVFLPSDHLPDGDVAAKAAVLRKAAQHWICVEASVTPSAVGSGI